MMDEKVAVLDAQMTPSSDHRQSYRAIGQRLQKARMTQGRSTQDLANCTWVSHAVIQALEVGDRAQLPEDVYLRPLVQRLGDELGWADIHQELPQATAVNVVPSWYNPKLAANLNARLVAETPLQTYMGYVLMLTGLVSSVSWLTYSEWQLQAQEQNPAPTTTESRACRFNCQPEQKPTGAAPTVRSGIEWSR